MRMFSMLIMSAFLFSTSVSAQETPSDGPEELIQYSEDELSAFVQVAQKVMPLQQESQMKMMEEIEEEDLTVDRFNNILEARSTGADVDATEEELNGFNNALENIQNLQDEYNERITEVITEEGMSVEKYEEIIANYQQDPQLQLRINEMMDEMQKDEMNEQ